MAKKYDDVVLGIPNADGKIELEHIPHTVSAVERWLRWRYILLLVWLRRDLYYWQLRFQWSPELRKSLDIAFMEHALFEHDGEPEIAAER